LELSEYGQSCRGWRYRDIGSGVCPLAQQKPDLGELLLVARHQQRLLDLQTSLGGGRILALGGGTSGKLMLVFGVRASQSLTIDRETLKNPCLMIDGGYPKNLTAKWPAPAYSRLKGESVEILQQTLIGDMAVADMENPQRPMFACFAEADLAGIRRLHTKFQLGEGAKPASPSTACKPSASLHAPWLQALGANPATLPLLASTAH